MMKEEIDSTMWVTFKWGSNPQLFALEVQNSDDVWRSIDRYDEEHGTNFYDALNEVEGVSDEKPSGASPITRINAKSAMNSDEALQWAEASELGAWENDGDANGMWYAVQRGFDSDGNPITVRYEFPEGADPQNDDDIASMATQITAIISAVE